jgi:Icc-related predicted phosphoesterase
MRQFWSHVHTQADVLLLAGDLTTHGERGQAAVLARELEVVEVPIIAVLGNHDYHSDAEHEVREELERSGIIVLEGESATISIGGTTLGVAGTKGFGGGFAGSSLTPFGEPEMKAFIYHTESLAAKLEENLTRLDADYRVALLHYSPIKETLSGERLEIFPFLGSYLLAEAADSAGADLILHGHAHHGQEKGVTARGIPVRNVALPVLNSAYAIYNLEKSEQQEVDREEMMTGASLVR